MPVNFTWEDKGLYWDFYGTLDGKLLMASNGQAVADPRFEEIKYIIWDSSNVNHVDMNNNDAELNAFFMGSVERYNPGIKLAFVTPDQQIRSIAEYYIDFSRTQGVGWEQRIFSNLQDARAWVNP